MVTDPSLAAALREVYWIGGGSGAGKSAVARRLGLPVYSTDDAMADHAGRLSPEDSPFLRAFAAMDLDERWVTRPPQVMLETFGWYRGEGFGLIAEDLLGSGPVIAEGFRLLPRLVAPLAAPGHAVWLLPEPGFRRAVFESRAPALRFWQRTSDPDRALRNLLDRDRMFTDQVRDQAGRLARPVIEVSTAMTEEDLTERVAKLFGF